MSTVGTFTIIKNEARWIRAHILSWLPWVDEMIFFDGNSTDGTLDIIRDIRKSHPFGKRIKLHEGKDCANLQADYQRLFNECLRSLSTDYAIFAHPDMILDEPGNIGFLGDAVAYTVSMRSFAGEPDGQLYEIMNGRAKAWKNIYRLRNPDLGLHFFGDYGAIDEDFYFSKITGKEHKLHTDFSKYPYDVKDSGIKISHFSDVRPLERRIDRMVKCIINNGFDEKFAREVASNHPRVTFQAITEVASGLAFKPGHEFEFVPVETPAYLKEGVHV